MVNSGFHVTLLYVVGPAKNLFIWIGKEGTRPRYHLPEKTQRRVFFGSRWCNIAMSCWIWVSCPHKHARRKIICSESKDVYGKAQMTSLLEVTPLCTHQITISQDCACQDLCTMQIANKLHIYNIIGIIHAARKNMWKQHQFNRGN